MDFVQHCTLWNRRADRVRVGKQQQMMIRPPVVTINAKILCQQNIPQLTGGLFIKRSEK